VFNRRAYGSNQEEQLRDVSDNSELNGVPEQQAFNGVLIAFEDGEEPDEDDDEMRDSSSDEEADEEPEDILIVESE
jgi:hypothetical protein